MLIKAFSFIFPRRDPPREPYGYYGGCGQPVRVLVRVRMRVRVRYICSTHLWVSNIWSFTASGSQISRLSQFLFHVPSY